MVAVSDPISVLLADPSDLTRSGLRSLLDKDSRFAVVGETASDGVAIASRLHPDLIVVDPARGETIDQRITQGLHAAAPAARVVVLTTVFEPHSFIDTMLQRVHSYLLKNAGMHAELLLDAFALIARFGAVVVDAAIAEHFWSLPGTPIAAHVPVPAVLTTREVEVLMLAIQGKSDLEIAGELQIARVTAEIHIRNIMAKFGAATRLQLGVIAARAGLG